MEQKRRSAHARGPWKHESKAERRFDSRTGERIEDYVTSWIKDSKGEAVAIVCDHSDPDGSRARLIASAPDMREALKKLAAATEHYVSCGEDAEGEHPHAQLYHLAMSAVVRAEGRE